MTEQTNEWWKGLGEELETDIETLERRGCDKIIFINSCTEQRST